MEINFIQLTYGYRRKGKYTNRGKHLGWYKNGKLPAEKVEVTYYLNDISDPLTQVLMTCGEDGRFDAAYTYGLERIEVEDIDETRPESQDPLYFTDAGSTYYTGYLVAAKRLGISAGLGSNMFAPKNQITRQEMFTLLYNALKAIAELPRGNSGKQLSSFSDAEHTSSGLYTSRYSYLYFLSMCRQIQQK